MALVKSTSTFTTAVLDVAKIAVGSGLGVTETGDEIVPTETHVRAALAVGAVGGAAVQGMRHNAQIKSGQIRPFKYAIV